LRPGKDQGDYIKHIYWVTRAEAMRITEELESAGTRVSRARGVVCTPLDVINRVSIVEPDVWNQTCARQGSWYRASEKSGLFLIVSGFELEGYGIRKSAMIRSTDFRPPRYAEREEKHALISNGRFRDLIPPEWAEIREIEKNIYLRWARRLGSDVGDYDFLYLTHTANHANFIEPRLFVREGDDIIPYSIDRSAHLCSCCLEIYQVLGEEYPKKLVAPCPGATIFARLTPDKYLLVDSGRNRKELP